MTKKNFFLNIISNYVTKIYKKINLKIKLLALIKASSNVISFLL